MNENVPTEHTPVPWRVKTEQKCAHGRHVHVGPNRGPTVADVHLWCGQADAEFIVRACNAHEDLLAACEAALKDLCAHQICTRFYCSLCAYDTVAQVKTAIAKARGTE